MNFQGTIVAEEEDDSVMYSKKKEKKKKSQAHDHEIMSGTSDAVVAIKKLPLSTTNLQRVWAATRRVSKDDWLEWLRRLSIELLKESPSPSLRSCWALAQAYNQLPK